MSSKSIDARTIVNSIACLYWGADLSSQPTGLSVLSWCVDFEPMDIEAQQQERRDNILSSLNAAIEALNVAGGISDIIPVKVVFGTVSVVLTMIRVSFPLVTLTDCKLKRAQDSMINQADYVDLGLACADVCIALDRGLKGKRLGDLNNSVLEAIEQLRT